MAIPNIWRTKKQRYSLEGTVCPTCQVTMFPPRKHCHHCTHTANRTNEGANEGANDANYRYFMVFDLSQNTASPVAGDD
ncbi:MAG: hypothetical protein KF832_16140 [Caldilineaceae bacterium]|nr:hypothetical protein [Caldilineaceae bacterium]